MAPSPCRTDLLLEQSPGLAAIAVAQHDVVGRDQLARLGFTPGQVTGHVKAGRWRPLGPLVVALHRGPLPPVSRLWAVTLHCGPLSALCAWTALAVWGLQGWAREATHVVVPRGATPVALPEPVGPVVIHKSRRHHEAAIRRFGGLPVHGAARAAVDAAAWSSSDRAACGVLAAVVQQRLTTPQALLTALDEAGRIRRRRLMAAVVTDIEGGSHALSEIDFLKFCTRFRLPRPQRQVVRRDAQGRRRYLDAVLRRRDGREVAIEIDGIGHMEVGQWYDDLFRGLELARPDGSVQLRIPALALRLEPERLAAALHRLGL